MRVQWFFCQGGSGGIWSIVYGGKKSPPPRSISPPLFLPPRTKGNMKKRLTGFDEGRPAGMGFVRMFFLFGVENRKIVCIRVPMSVSWVSLRGGRGGGGDHAHDEP